MKHKPAVLYNAFGLLQSDFTVPFTKFDSTGGNPHHKRLLAELVRERRINTRYLVCCISAISASLSGTASIAQGNFIGGGTSGGGTGLLAQAPPSLPATPIFDTPRVSGPTGTTILPTDVLPLPTIQNRMTFGENLQLRVLQKLPARFYFTGSVESSFRYETNVFQFPKKSRLVRQLPPPQTIRRLSAQDQLTVSNILSLASREDVVFRVLPNVTGGFALTPRTRVFGNYFMIRDSLFQNTRLNTTIHSVAYGAQHDFPLAQRANLQAEIQFRELFQAHQQPVFDFLPGLTLSYVLTPRTVLFANALLQMRGKKYFQAPTKEIDPFYTWGALHQRGGWSFSASSTFVQNFREPFRRNATIPVNNYAFICDFEVARRLFRQLPGLQAFIRAEPIFNFHSHERPGLAGTDFRLFCGLRMAASKPALTTALDSLRRQLEEQEVAPPPSIQPKSKPSAYLSPEQVIAGTPQPIHGPMAEPVAYKGTGSSDSLLSLHDEIPAERSTQAVIPSLALKQPIIPAPSPAIRDQIADREQLTEL